MKIIYTFIAFICIFSNTYTQNIPSDEKSKLINSVSQFNLKNSVKYLSSNKLKGRLSGDPSYKLASDYVVDKFKNYKIKPGIKDTYLQEFEVEYNKIYEPINVSLFLNNKEQKLNLGTDYVFRGFTGKGKIKSKIVFCGYGISNQKIGFDDYEAVDVKNKIVMVFKYNPGWTINNESIGSPSLRAKTKIAKDKGAIGIVFISFPNDKNPQKPIGSVLDGSEEHIEDVPQIHLDLKQVEKIFSNENFDIKKIQTIIDSTRQPHSLNLNSELSIEVNTLYKKNVKTWNVVGLVQGSDPILKNEYIIVGAHLDHVGYQGKNIIFSGANDNASGSSSVIELSRLFSKIKTKRSIYFVLFACEEIGLVGSKYFASNLPIEKEKIVAMLNLDCVGYGDSMQVGNGLSVPKLYQIAMTNDSLYTKYLIKNTWKGGGADAAPFHDLEIPSLYFVTKNSYQNLHLTSDTYSTLNYNLLTKITQLASLTLFDLVNGAYVKEEITK